MKNKVEFIKQKDLDHYTRDEQKLFNIRIAKMPLAVRILNAFMIILFVVWFGVALAYWLSPADHESLKWITYFGFIPSVIYAIIIFFVQRNYDKKINEELNEKFLCLIINNKKVYFKSNNQTIFYSHKMAINQIKRNRKNRA